MWFFTDQIEGFTKKIADDWNQNSHYRECHFYKQKRRPGKRLLEKFNWRSLIQNVSEKETSWGWLIQLFEQILSLKGMVGKLAVRSYKGVFHCPTAIHWQWWCYKLGTNIAESLGLGLFSVGLCEKRNLRVLYWNRYGSNYEDCHCCRQYSGNF